MTGCTARKQVQRSEDDSMFKITYHGKHTCARLLPMLPLLRELEQQQQQQQQQEQQTLLDLLMEPEVLNDVQIPSLELSLSNDVHSASVDTSSTKNSITLPLKLEKVSPLFDKKLSDPELSLSSVFLASVDSSSIKNSITLPSKLEKVSPLFDEKLSDPELSLSSVSLASVDSSNTKNSITLRADHFMDEANERASSLSDRKLSRRAILRKHSAILLKENSPPPNILHGFFEHIHHISVLDLSHTKIEFLPESISDLKNLRKLLFRHCERLKMVPSLAMLKELRVLDLSHTIIKELPQGMDELVNLRLLDLSYTRNLQTYLGGVLQKLSLLEDFLMFDSRCSWQSNSSDVLGGADIKEIISATHLVNLAIRFLDLPSFIGYVRSGHWRMLKSFRFDIGQLSYFLPLASFRWKYSVQILGCDLVDEKDSLMLPNNTLELVIKNCHSVSCLSEMQWLLDLNDLKECIVMDCDTMECILMGEKNTLPTMEELILYNLPNLRTLYSGVLPFGALSSLKSVTVEHCHSLKNLFSFGLFQHLQNLEYVKLWMCDQIEEIVAEDEGMANRDHSNTITLPRIKELWLGFLRELRSISKRVVVCDSLVTIVVQNCPKLKKLPLSVGNFAPLEKIRGSRKWWDALEWDELNIKTLLQTIFIEQSDLESESELGSESEKEDQDDDEDIEDEEDNDDDDDDDEGGQRKRRKVQP